MSLIYLENEYLKASADTRGGQLMSLYGKKSQTEYLWNGDAAYWEDRAPNLFPVCGRLKNLTHTVNGKACSMPLHGFLRSSELALTAQTPDSVTFRLDDSPATREAYPFGFSLELTLSLHGPVLRWSYRVCAGEDALVFSWGGHPGFRLPLEEGYGYEDYRVEFGAPCAPLQLSITPDGLMGKELTPFALEDGRGFALRRSLFAVEGVFLRNTPGEVSLCRGDRKFLTLRYPDCPVLGFWTACGGQAPFICFEPWAGSPDPQDSEGRLESKPDTVRLPAGGEYRGGFEIEIHA